MDFVRLKDFVSACLFHWRWFVASAIVITGLAVLRMLQSPSVFSRTMSVQVKDETTGKSASSTSVTFEDLGLIQSKSNVTDEMVAMQSPSVMTEVVKRLDLCTNYTSRQGLCDQTLYGAALPVSVSLPDWLDYESCEFDLTLEGDGAVLTDFVKNGERVKDAADMRVALGDTVSSPLGRMVLTPNRACTEWDQRPVHVTVSPLLPTVRACGKRLTVELSDEKGSIVDLKFDDTCIPRIEDVLQTLLAVYNEMWVEDKNRIIVATTQFINERINVIEHELGNVDEDISSYKSKNLIPDLRTVSDRYVTQNFEVDDRLLTLNNQLYMVRYVRDYLSDDGNVGKLLPINSGIEDVGIENQLSEYNNKLLQRNTLEAGSSAANPLVRDLDKVLAALRKSITASIDNQYYKLKKQIESLQKDKNQVTEHLAANPTQAKFLLSVERQQKVKESLYLFLLQKREENELAHTFVSHNTRVITPPYGDDVPVAPQKRNVILFSFVLSLLVPAAFLFVKESLDTKVRGRKDLESLSVPFVGEIPEVVRQKSGWLRWRRREADTKIVVVEEGGRDYINEAFRVVRTNLEFMTGNDKQSNVIVVTSFNPGSGKSFFTVNMAVSLAIKGKKVLVIDGDLRHGSFSSRYAGSPKAGLSDYLGGYAEKADDVIVTDRKYPGLRMIAVGTVPPNPTELLSNGRFRQLIEAQKGQYDYVLVDCPPIELVADTRIIEQYADHTLFIIRAGLLERSLLTELETSYREKRYKNMSMVLNATDTKHHSGYYYYGYGYGYNYYK